MKFKGVCFDERRDLVSYVESGIIEEDHIGRTIYKRARYNYFVKKIGFIEKYLNDFEQITVESEIPMQPAFAEPVDVVEEYPISDFFPNLKDS